jgi:hypothetical protein
LMNDSKTRGSRHREPAAVAVSQLDVADLHRLGVCHVLGMLDAQVATPGSNPRVGIMLKLCRSRWPRASAG